jgi:hypothetical protein
VINASCYAVHDVKSNILSIICSGSQVVIVVKLEREDEEEGSPHVIAPFFPQVRSLFVSG